MPRRVLLLYAHPAHHRSRVNRALVAAARSVEGVTVHDLYETYPTLDIDVPAEQALVEAHEVLAWQHPLYWYSTPAVLKEWQDQVLTLGWAYGPGGTRLQGKPFVLGLSTAGSAEAYTPAGFHGTTLEALLAPIRQTARLCQLRWLPPTVAHSAHRLDREEIAAAAAQWRARLMGLVAGEEAP